MELEFYIARDLKFYLKPMQQWEYPRSAFPVKAAYHEDAWHGKLYVLEHQVMRCPLYQVRYDWKPPVTLRQKLPTEGMKMMLLLDGNLHLDIPSAISWDVNRGKICFFQNLDQLITVAENCGVRYFVCPVEVLVENLDWEGFPEGIYDLTPAMHLALDEILQPPSPLRDGGGWLTTRLLMLLQSLQEHLKTPKSGKLYNREAQLNAADTYIRNNLHRTVYYEEIAKAIGMNESTLVCAFRKHFGMTVMQRLKHHRNELSLKLLRDMSRTINSIAAACGFESPDAFRVSFESIHKITPSEWRKNNVS
ncbi:helix-turn-helix transcriptional regulator [Flavihumibacter petaseus]|uniref:Putative AraC family transcriptional regulator n=1 Tax=Flavihumibacter petaseus NBRC 106054 TaxID=1220578 RepID=A0A0E9MXI9_9BACT|nr:AraC family transcriptional regulator [Flavihumibacter petaseus]GAO42329.1 putative AraC family transcriptional regulator [Flavihumibacter petaseus NBRC 106054]